MQHIQSYAIKERHTSIFIPETYTLNKKGKLVRLIINCLKKYRVLVDYHENKVEFKRIVIDNKKVFEVIQEQLTSILRRGGQPTRAILGHDTFEQLGIELYQQHSFMTKLPYAWGEPGPYARREILGLEIILLPHIDGVIVF